MSKEMLSERSLPEIEIVLPEGDRIRPLFFHNCRDCNVRDESSANCVNKWRKSGGLYEEQDQSEQ